MRAGGNLGLRLIGKRCEVLESIRSRQMVDWNLFLYLLMDLTGISLLCLLFKFPVERSAMLKIDSWIE
jgi:hypothetical protein